MRTMQDLTMLSGRGTANARDRRHLLRRGGPATRLVLGATALVFASDDALRRTVLSTLRLSEEYAPGKEKR